MKSVFRRNLLTGDVPISQHDHKPVNPFQNQDVTGSLFGKRYYNAPESPTSATIEAKSQKFLIFVGMAMGLFKNKKIADALLQALEKGAQIEFVVNLGGYVRMEDYHNWPHSKGVNLKERAEKCIGKGAKFTLVESTPEDESWYIVGRLVEGKAVPESGWIVRKGGKERAAHELENPEQARYYFEKIEQLKMEENGGIPLNHFDYHLPTLINRVNKRQREKREKAGAQVKTI